MAGKEHPILFSTENVKAILEGRKTQTRRLVKPQPDKKCDQVVYDPAIGWRFRYSFNKLCPYGQVGDRLWVRETFAPYSDNSGVLAYKADGWDSAPEYTTSDGKDIPCHWKPSIHMYRCDSRIDLEITDIRVERLQHMSSYDAQCEGVHTGALGFAELWDSLNAKRGYSWESNPWVWVISFKRQNPLDTVFSKSLYLDDTFLGGEHNVGTIVNSAHLNNKGGEKHEDTGGSRWLPV